MFLNTASPAHGYVKIIFTAIKLTSYENVKEATISALDTILAGNTAAQAGIRLAAEKFKMYNENDIDAFLNFVAFGRWQDLGIPIVSEMESFERLAVLETICGACRGIISDSLSVLDLTPSMPEGWDVSGEIQVSE